MEEAVWTEFYNCSVWPYGVGQNEASRMPLLNSPYIFPGIIPDFEGNVSAQPKDGHIH